MARVSTYLNFVRETEQAFNFYRQVFGTEFEGQVARFGDVPPQPGQPPLPEADKRLIMHIALPILGGHRLLGTDAPASMGFKLVQGTNFYINLEPDTRKEADRLFQGLSAGGKVDTPMQEMFWGAYWGNFTDRFGIQWMINCMSKT
jgi:PhnB protein